MVHTGWYKDLKTALDTNPYRSLLMQFATIEAPNTIEVLSRPHARTLAQREFVTSDATPTVPLILTTTDVRAPKVEQLSGNNLAETVYLTGETADFGSLKHIRILGRASIVAATDYSGPYPKPKGVVYDALIKEGFDWEQKRRDVFNKDLDDRIRATFCRPAPGTPASEEDRKKWPVAVPDWDHATTDQQKEQWKTAFGNFSLLLLEPFEVDYLEHDWRTLYKRDWNDEDNIEFKKTVVVP